VLLYIAGSSLFPTRLLQVGSNISSINTSCSGCLFMGNGLWQCLNGAFSSTQKEGAMRHGYFYPDFEKLTQTKFQANN
jgi:hypothetical protein